MKKAFAILAGLIFCVLLGLQVHGTAQRRDALAAAAVPAFGNVLGDPQGRVKVIEFVDYRCPHCVRMNQNLTQALSAEKGVQVVIRPLPWLGNESADIALLVLAAGLQGKDIILHNALMAAGNVKTYQDARGIAQDVGVNVLRAESDMRSKDIDTALRQNVAYASKIGVKTLPALAIGGRMVMPKSETDFPGVDALRKVIHNPVQ